MRTSRLAAALGAAGPAVLAAAVAVPGVGGAEGPAILALSPGPLPVGFRVLARRDPGRRLADGSLRPVQVAAWYPAAASPAAPMTYGDYVRVSARERTLTALAPAEEEAAMARYRAFLVSNGLPAAGVEDWLGMPMLARPEVPAAGGRFPIVLLAAGTGGAVQDQAALAESLAGHGYVVATTPSPLRLGARMESDADVPVMAEDQARDLDIALAALGSPAMSDATRAAVVGYSFGARPALLLVGRRPSLRALVSLDGGIGSAAAPGWLSARALDRAAVRTPILHVYEENDEDARPDFALLASLRRAPRTLARVDILRHLDFITLGLATSSLPSLGGPEEARRAALGAVFDLTRAFLDAHVKEDEQAWRAAAAAPSLHIVPFGSASPSPAAPPRRRSGP